jgi:hypothetical protein
MLEYTRPQSKAKLISVKLHKGREARDNQPSDHVPDLATPQCSPLLDLNLIFGADDTES